MLASARSQYVEQQRITALALRQSRRRAGGGSVAVARVLASYQAEAVALALDSGALVLAEQGIEAPAVARVAGASLLTGTRAASLMLDTAATDAAFDRIVSTLVNDAGRTAATVDIARRPAVTGYVRSLNLPSCGRCVVLAGRVYRYSQGFQRHPLCDCMMTATTMAAGRGLVTDPYDAVERGMVRGLSRGDRAALDAGADLGQVVNVRRKRAGLTVGSSVMERAGRLTPQGVMRVASDRAQAIDLLRRYGYLT